MAVSNMSLLMVLAPTHSVRPIAHPFPTPLAHPLPLPWGSLLFQPLRRALYKVSTMALLAVSRAPPPSFFTQQMIKMLMAMRRLHSFAWPCHSRCNKTIKLGVEETRLQLKYQSSYLLKIHFPLGLRSTSHCQWTVWTYRQMNSISEDQTLTNRHGR